MLGALHGYDLFDLPRLAGMLSAYDHGQITDLEADPLFNILVRQ